MDVFKIYHIIGATMVENKVKFVSQQVIVYKYQNVELMSYVYFWPKMMYESKHDLSRALQELYRTIVFWARMIISEIKSKTTRAKEGIRNDLCTSNFILRRESKGFTKSCRWTHPQIEIILPLQTLFVKIIKF